MPEPVARTLFRDLVKGVSYAHMHHVTHRDLKLENVLIAR
jgi:serine/threonine protein kinase